MRRAMDGPPTPADCRLMAKLCLLCGVSHKRHSKAMHLYEAGVPLPYIRDILGHVELSTTEIYARASTEAKRKALEAAYQDIVTSDLPEWNQDASLIDWLANL